jgi:lipoprotein
VGKNSKLRLREVVIVGFLIGFSGCLGQTSAAA